MTFNEFRGAPLNAVGEEWLMLIAPLLWLLSLTMPLYIVWKVVPESLQYFSVYCVSYVLFGGALLSVSLLCFDGIARVIGRTTTAFYAVLFLLFVLSGYVFDVLIAGISAPFHYSFFAPLFVPDFVNLHPESLLKALIAYIGLPGCFLAEVMAAQIRKNKPSGSHFQTFLEMAQGKKFTHNSGFVVGSKEGCTTYMNAVALTLVSNPRSGKSLSVIVQSILNDTGSIIVNDNRGELHALLKVVLHNRGYEVKVWSPYGAISDGWNILFLIRWDEFHYSDDLDVIFNVLVPMSSNESNSAFFRNNSIHILKGLVIYQYLTYGRCPERLTLKAIIELATTTGLKETIDEAIETSLRVSPEQKHLGLAVQMSLSKIKEGADEKTISNVLFSVQDYLSRLYSPKALVSLSQNDIDIRKIRREKTAIFIEVPGNRATVMKPYLTLFYQFFLSNTVEEGAMIKDKHLRVTCYLDEFGNMSRIDDLVKASTELGAFGLRFLFALQNMSQAYKEYGREDAETIFSAGIKMLGTSNNQLDCEHFSKAMGEQEVNRQEGSGDNIRRFTETRLLMKPDAIRRMSSKNWIVIPEGECPVKVKKAFWFNDKKLKKLLPNTHKPII